MLSRERALLIPLINSHVFNDITSHDPFCVICAEAFQDLLLLRYCLCSVARALARELAAAQPNAFSTHIRRTLFFAFSSWTEEGSIPGVALGLVCRWIHQIT